MIDLPSNKSAGEWAQAIADRVADESSYDEDDKKILNEALTKALTVCPDAILMLIGTGIIEESYFDDIKATLEEQAWNVIEHFAQDIRSWQSQMRGRDLKAWVTMTSEVFPNEDQNVIIEIATYCKNWADR